MYDASRHYEPLPIMISPMTDEDSWGDDTLYMAFCHGFPDMVNDSAQHSARSAAIRLCALGAARPQGHVSVVSQISASNSNRLECDPAYLHIYLPHICSVRFIHLPSRTQHHILGKPAMSRTSRRAARWQFQRSRFQAREGSVRSRRNRSLVGQWCCWATPQVVSSESHR